MILIQFNLISIEKMVNILFYFFILVYVKTPFNRPPSTSPLPFTLINYSLPTKLDINLHISQHTRIDPFSLIHLSIEISILYHLSTPVYPLSFHSIPIKRVKRISIFLPRTAFNTQSSIPFSHSCHSTGWILSIFPYPTLGFFSSFFQQRLSFFR